MQLAKYVLLSLVILGFSQTLGAQTKEETKNLVIEDSLPIIAVRVGTNLRVSYLDSLGVNVVDTLREDSMAAYPTNLAMNYEVKGDSTRRIAISLGDSVLPLRGAIKLKAREVLLVESAERLDWGADSVVLVGAYLSFLNKPSRVGLANLKKTEDKVRTKWGSEGEAVVRMLKYFANPDLLADTLIRLDVALPGPNVFRESTLKERIRQDLAHPEKQDATKVLAEALGRCIFIVETLGMLGDKVMAADAIAVRKRSSACQAIGNLMKQRNQEKAKEGQKLAFGTK